MSDFAGADWVRVDLHLHSPAVESFAVPPGLDGPKNRSKAVAAYVAQLVKEGFRVCALTDYNGVHKDWYEPIRDEAAKNGIVVLPGAEVSFEAGKYGLHVLVIFPENTNIDAINRAISGLDKNPATPLFADDGTHRNLDPKDQIVEALGSLRRQFGAIIVFAHPNDKKGLFTTYDLAAAGRLVGGTRPDAIEAFDERDRKRLTNNEKLDPRVCERLACVEFSDPKAITEIGTKSRPDGSLRVTYLKLSDTSDLVAMRLALADPEVRVAIGSCPAPAHSRLLAVEIEGSGFLGGLNLTLSPDLNVLIGGRGVGKSALLEAIRYALDVQPITPSDYRTELVKFALGSGGRVRLTVEQVLTPDVRRRYRIERVLGEAPRVFELNPEKEVDLAPHDVLSDRGMPLFFGQREIYDCARSSTERVRLLDDLIGRRAREKRAEVKRLEDQARANAREILELTTKLADKEESEHRLKEIEHDIELYKREGLAEKLKDAASLAQDEERLSGMIEAVGSLGVELGERHDQTLQSLEEVAALSSSAISPNKQLLVDAAVQLRRAAEELRATYDSEIAIVARLTAALGKIESSWKADRKPLDEEIDKIKRELGPTTLDPDHLEDLSREQTRLRSSLDKLKSTEEERDAKVKARQKLLKGLRDTRHEAFRLRQERATEVTDRLHGRVRLEIEYKGQRDDFVDLLVRLVQGSGLDRKSLEKLAKLPGKLIDGADIAEAVRHGADVLQKTFALSSAKASQAVKWLSEDEGRLFELELATAEDTVEVYLDIDGTERPLSKLSDGQKATAMLLLLLVQVERFLIVDQPEDDLDNRFIYDDIVRILRDQKGERQIVVATHNPNIPVLGDAELIAVLESVGGKGHVVQVGSVDGTIVRERVKRIMEGGEEAFRLRAEKYGWVAAGAA